MKYFLIVFVFVFAPRPSFAQEPEADLTSLIIFGDSLSQWIYRLDAEKVKGVFDVDSLLSDAVVFDPDDPQSMAFHIGFREGFTEKFDYAQFIFPEILKGADYDFISYYQAGPNEYHLMFRLFSDEGLNYHDYRLFKDEAGAYRIRDVYFYLTGEPYSLALRRIYLMAYNELTQLENPDLENARIVQGIQKMVPVREKMMAGDFPAAWALLQTMPEELMRDKSILTTKIQVAMNLNDSLYLEALNEYIDLYPHDPSVFLVSIDKYIMDQNFDQALNMVDSLDASVYGDEFLEFYRGNINYMKGDMARAEKHFRSLLEYFPDYVEGHDRLLTVYAETEQYPKAVEVLDVFLNKFEVDKMDVVGYVTETYPKFARSEAFKAWAKK